MKLATGTFDVNLAPLVEEESRDLGADRMSIDKQFHGDLEGTSVGQMLSIRTAVEGSAGYVAMEQVTGTLDGRSGTFALQHSGTMTRGVPGLSVTVVPDSGTEQLEGIEGEMTINLSDGQHFYEFKYDFAS
ncbi:DUF3224 domain-containing protein [Chloroflexi bacterium TSY]|nr:DUF3224 domain-containing protein [Chloroflexi bacterium TSY]